jgi:hypothetical protein
MIIKLNVFKDHLTINQIQTTPEGLKVIRYTLSKEEQIV